MFKVNHVFSNWYILGFGWVLKRLPLTHFLNAFKVNERVNDLERQTDRQREGDRLRETVHFDWKCIRGAEEMMVLNSFMVFRNIYSITVICLLVGFFIWLSVLCVRLLLLPKFNTVNHREKKLISFL